MRAILLVAWTLGLNGCGSSNEAVFRDAVLCLHETAALLESISDRPSAEQARPRLEKLAERWSSIRRSLEGRNLDQQTKEKLAEQFRDEIAAAAERLRKADEKLPAEAREALKDVRGKFLL